LDPLTASGVPVHDAFLLTVGEMGIFAGALIWLPFALLLIRAIRSSRTAGAVGLTARAYLAIVPALLLTGVTGWGLLQAPTFELFALVAGLFAGQLSTEPEPEGVIEDTRAGVALA
jgi:hypothetical protein